ncbi:MAG: flagellar basal body P-ring formation chaperone FlgA [Planctomycetota bacterium]|nr:flagellar basal body P-ring formation chaperone FlgA [Planctomycetota bacterium]
MQFISPIQFVCVILAVCGSFASDALSFAANAGEIRIQLNEAAVVHGNQVLLGSISTVECSDPIRKKEVENLEVRLLDLTKASETISQRFVNIRLVIAGFRMEELNLSGAEQTVVVFQPSQKLTDSQIEDEALVIMSQAMNAEPQDLKVLLQSGFVQSLPPDLREKEGVKLKILPPGRRSLGSVTLSVQLWENEELLATRSALFDVRRRHRVAVARISLSREVPLNESNVQFENRFMTTEVDELEPNQVLGRTVRGSVVAGSIVQMRDLQTTMRSNADLLIRKGDSVQVIAVAQRLRTSMRNVEALDGGRLGERIRLKNRDSGKEFVGDVLGPGQAIVRVR